MKKKVLGMAAIMLALSTASFAQNYVNAPAAVKASFAKDFPRSTTKWEKEGTNYEANFKENGKSHVQRFTIVKGTNSILR